MAEQRIFDRPVAEVCPPLPAKAEPDEVIRRPDKPADGPAKGLPMEKIPR